MLLEGKVSIITGAANGLGKAIALAYAREGSKVAIIDIKQEDGVESANEINEFSEARFYYCDLRSVSEIEKAIQAIYKDFGKIDVLVNCAGLANRTPNDEITEDEWDLLNDVNLKAAFFASKEVYKVMQTQNGGRIINISSVRAHIADGKHTIYDVTKAGLQAMSRSFAVSGAPYNIVANTLSFCYVLTPMTTHNLDRKEWFENTCKRTAVGRLLTVEEAANTALFLASDLSSGILGQNIVVDNGWTIKE